VLLKGALHTHSTCSDGTLTVAELLATYERLGFDFVALTDHDHLLPAGCYDAGLDLETSLLVLRGVELTVFEKGYVHVNRIEGDRDVLYVFNHPAEMDLPLPKAIERILAVAERLPLDAVEITSKGFRTPEFDVPDLPLVKVATDDAHTRAMCGRAWIELDAPRDRDAIIRAVRRGDFWNCYADNRGAASRGPRRR
jgi:predicted metal-dependent phosphoesterase TrpH